MALYLNEVDFVQMKVQVRKYAVENLSWQKNSEILGKLVTDCESLEMNNESKVAANQIDQYKLPYFEKFRTIYYIAYDLHRFFKK
jgi:hypothetical protein